jgi:hypothetical protein
MNSAAALILLLIFLSRFRQVVQLTLLNSDLHVIIRVTVTSRSVVIRAQYGRLPLIVILSSASISSLRRSLRPSRFHPGLGIQQVMGPASLTKPIYLQKPLYHHCQNRIYRGLSTIVAPILRTTETERMSCRPDLKYSDFDTAATRPDRCHRRQFCGGRTARRQSDRREAQRSMKRV